MIGQPQTYVSFARLLRTALVDYPDADLADALASLADGLSSLDDRCEHQRRRLSSLRTESLGTESDLHALVDKLEGDHLRAEFEVALTQVLIQASALRVTQATPRVADAPPNAEGPGR